MVTAVRTARTRVVPALQVGGELSTGRRSKVGRRPTVADRRGDWMTWTYVRGCHVTGRGQVRGSRSERAGWKRRDGAAVFVASSHVFTRPGQCVQFLAECVHFWARCVQFGGECVQFWAMRVSRSSAVRGQGFRRAPGRSRGCAGSGGRGSEGWFDRLTRNGDGARTDRAELERRGPG